MKLPQSIKNDPSWIAFLIAVLAVGFSMPLSRLFTVISLVLTLFHRPLGQRIRFRLTAPCIGWLAYLALALIVSTVMAIRAPDELLIPRKGLSKIFKLAWFFLIPLGVAQINTRERLATTLKILVLGCAATGLYVILINPIAAWVQVTLPTDRQITSGSLTAVQHSLLTLTNTLGLTGALNKWIYSGYRATSYQGSLFKLGTMGDAQRLMVALPAALCLCLEAFRINATRRRKLLSAIFTLIILFGLILTFKRGPLIFGLIVSFVILFRTVGFKALAIGALVMLLASAHPGVRARFTELPGEFSANKGGRWTMWTKIVPKLHEEHPWGIGFRALTPEKMRQLSRRVEQRQNHVHSTPLQAFVDFGWAGIIAYTGWMLAAMITAMISLRKSTTASHLRFVPLAMLSALILYGLMEYNLADADVVLLYSLAMAMASFVDLPAQNLCTPTRTQQRGTPARTRIDPC